MIDVSIIVPSYDENEDNLTKLCAGIKDSLRADRLSYEIIFVASMRDEQHGLLLKKFASQDSISCILYKGNNNQSQAYNAGLKKATGNHIILIDADMCENTKDIPRFINELNQGYTFVQGNRLNRNATVCRKFFSWGFNLCVSMVKMERVRDIGCGLIGFPRGALNQVQVYPGKIKDFVTLIMLKAKPVRKVDILVTTTRKSKYKLKKLVDYSMYLIDQLLEYFWLTKITKRW